MDGKRSTEVDTVEPGQLRQKVVELQQEVQRLSTLFSVARALNSQLDLAPLLNLSMEQVTLAMDAERSSLFLVDWDKMELWTKVAQGTEEIRLPLGQGIAGFVAVSGQTVFIRDAYDDPRFDSAVDKETGFRTRTMLAIPLRDREGQNIGVIEVLNKRNGEFTNRDKDLLEVLGGQVGMSLENARLYSETKEMFDSFVHSLTTALDARHPTTSGHSHRVMEYSLAIGRELGLEEEELNLLAYAALLHDLGKIGIDDAVLKKPGALDEKERWLMQQHPKQTHRILSRMRLSRQFRKLPEVAAGHHERLDGGGYPDGLSAEEIPLLSRIIAVADVFDAVTCWREYREPMDGQEALALLERESDRGLDPKVVEAFTRYYDKANIGLRIEKIREELRLERSR
jgi:HD-GYP domain-containing protein (c-di-GMP phosphodiesterase class II)